MVSVAYSCDAQGGSHDNSQTIRLGDRCSYVDMQWRLQRRAAALGSAVAAGVLRRWLVLPQSRDVGLV